MASGAESLGAGYVIKWLFGLFAGGIMFWIRSVHNKVNNTYTKKDVDDKIESKVAPLSKVVEENTEAIKEINKTSQRLCVLMARLEERIGGRPGA